MVRVIHTWLSWFFVGPSPLRPVFSSRAVQCRGDGLPAREQGAGVAKRLLRLLAVRRGDQGAQQPPAALPAAPRGAAGALPMPALRQGTIHK